MRHASCIVGNMKDNARASIIFHYGDHRYIYNLNAAGVKHAAGCNGTNCDVPCVSNILQLVRMWHSSYSESVSLQDFMLHISGVECIKLETA